LPCFLILQPQYCNSNIVFMKKNIWQSIAGVLIGGLFLYLTLRNKPLSEIVESIKNANLFWVILNSFILLLVFYLRAMRWKVLLENIDFHPKKKDVMYALTLGYFVNSFTPKFGEIARCTSLNKRSNIPISKSLGTVVSERIWDLLVLLAGLAAIFLLEIKRFGGIMSGIWAYIRSLFTNHLTIATIALCILLLGGYLFWVLFKKSNFIEKIRSFVKEIYETVKMTFKLKKATKFLFLTFLIWVSLIFMNITCLKALPETGNNSLYFATVILFVGGIGWALPSPGGIGTTHFIILQLFLAFGLSQGAGIAFGVLSNGLTFVYTILFGTVMIASGKILNLMLTHSTKKG